VNYGFDYDNYCLDCVQDLYDNTDVITNYCNYCLDCVQDLYDNTDGITVTIRLDCVEDFYDKLFPN